MYTTFPTTTEKNLLCSWNGQNNQSKWFRNIFSVWTLWFHVILGTTCSAKTPLLHVPVSELRLILSLLLTRRCEISLLVATRVSCNMHERAYLHNLQSLAGCELIQCFYQCRFQWQARLKEKKDLNNQYKSVTTQNVLSNKAALANAKKVKVVQSFHIPKVPYLLEKAPRCLWNIWTCR